MTKAYFQYDQYTLEYTAVSASHVSIVIAKGVSG